MSDNGTYPYNPELGYPGEERRVQVEPTARGIAPLEKVEFMSKSEAFVCTVANANMFTPGGTKIGFANGFIETNVKSVVEYLQREIDDGHPYIRKATSEEVAQHRMRVNPAGEIESNLRAKMEVEFQARLEAAIREKQEGRDPKEIEPQVDTEVRTRPEVLRDEKREAEGLAPAVRGEKSYTEMAKDREIAKEVAEKEANEQKAKEEAAKKEDEKTKQDKEDAAKVAGVDTGISQPGTKVGSATISQPTRSVTTGIVSSNQVASGASNSSPVRK